MYSASFKTALGDPTRGEGAVAGTGIVRISADPIYHTGPLVRHDANSISEKAEVRVATLRIFQLDDVNLVVDWLSGKKLATKDVSAAAENRHRLRRPAKAITRGNTSPESRYLRHRVVVFSNCSEVRIGRFFRKMALLKEPKNASLYQVELSIFLHAVIEGHGMERGDRDRQV